MNNLRSRLKVVNAELSVRPSSDNAMDINGGIDLKSRNMNLDVTKDGKGVEMKFDPAMMEQFKNGDFKGIVPVIINITPITSALPLLGMNEADAGHKST
ncbi:MAG: hypothetical protein V2A70_00550 [Candidatus Omnitrophota bacterium]